MRPQRLVDRPYDAGARSSPDRAGRPGIWHPHRDRPQGHDEGENGCRTGTRLGRYRPRSPALQAEPSIGLLLPCNVVVRSADEQTTVVEAVDPQTMVAMTANPPCNCG